MQLKYYRWLEVCQLLSFERQRSLGELVCAEDISFLAPCNFREALVGGRLFACLLFTLDYSTQSTVLAATHVQATHPHGTLDFELTYALIVHPRV
jgi:hypothetical protein